MLVTPGPVMTKQAATLPLARVAIRHEPGALFMARRDVVDFRVGEAAIEFDRVYARYPENLLDAVAFEYLDECFPARGHRRRLN